MTKQRMLIVAALIVISVAAYLYYSTRPTGIRSLHREGHPACGSTVQISGTVVGWPTMNLYSISDNPGDPNDALSQILVKPVKFADLPDINKTYTVSGTVVCGQYGVGRLDEVRRVLS